MIAKEILNKVANDNGYIDIVDCYNSRKPKYINDIVLEAMQLYAEEKCKEQRISCFESFPMGSIYREYYEDVKNRVLQTPLATDKP